MSYDLVVKSFDGSSRQISANNISEYFSQNQKINIVSDICLEFLYDHGILAFGYLQNITSDGDDTGSTPTNGCNAIHLSYEGGNAPS